MDPELHRAIFQINDNRTFRETALKVFHYQAENNQVYRDYMTGLGMDPRKIKEVEHIPFLPVEFFKTHKVLCKGLEPEVVFESSGTTQSNPAKHCIADLSIYRDSFIKGFQGFYGAPARHCIVALLPSYLERSGSSLVYMMDHLIKLSGHPDSGFYLDNLEELAAVLRKRNADLQSTLLVGVTFALLDLAESHPMDLGDHVVVMETGGMKGRGEELVRSELHETLTQSLGVSVIHSEYGMTELLSQGYSKGEGIFRTPPWMRVLIRDANDPLTLLPEEQTGGLNIIDLANLYSCSFIATGDLGKRYADGSFEVQGRYDHSDIRGCNLMVP
ncbi:MAG: acyltransferase [Bacteroidales bacterium]|nr:acyltransferase [Bacteroidales bacterium]